MFGAPASPRSPAKRSGPWRFSKRPSARDWIMASTSTATSTSNPCGITSRSKNSSGRRAENPQEFLEPAADVIPPADRADPPDDPSRLRDFETRGELEFGQGLEEARPAWAQVEKIDQRFFERGDLPRAVSRGSMAEEERGVDMVDRDLPQGGRIRSSPGDRNGEEHGGDLGDHPVMIERRLKRDIARKGRREIFRQGERIDPSFESPSAPAESRQVPRSGQPGQQLAGGGASDAKERRRVRGPESGTTPLEKPGVG